MKVRRIIIFLFSKPYDFFLIKLKILNFKHENHQIIQKSYICDIFFKDSIVGNIFPKFNCKNAQLRRK